MSEPENLVIVLLRELREDIRGLEGRLDRMEKRLDAMHLNGTKALKSFIGHRVMTERTIGSIDDQVGKLEMRVAALEAARV